MPQVQNPTGNRGVFARWAFAICAGLVLLSAMPLRADTIVLQDGTIVEGSVVRESRRYVRFKTRFGEKSYRRADIKELVKEDVEDSAYSATMRIHNFDKLPDMAKQLRNAQALYDLGRLDEIPPLVEPLIGKGTHYDDMQIRWLLIDYHERKAEWDKARELLEKTLKDGREPDKIRAQVHLDIFDANPGYKLRRVGERDARDFLDEDLHRRGKRRNALQDPELMHAALKEAMRQILRDPDVSIYALKKTMDVNETLAAVNEAIESKSHRPIAEILPYRKKLDEVQKSIYRAQAILPGAARGYELDMVRTEATHLRAVISELLVHLSEAYPGDASVAADEHGRLTPSGREQWRKMCDNFLDLSRPVVDLIQYLLQRTSAFPQELEPFQKEWGDALERVQQMQQNTVRNRDRTRL